MRQSFPVRSLGLVALGASLLFGIATPSQSADDAKTKKVAAGSLTLDVPESWKPRDKPSSPIRTAEIDVPAETGKGGEIVVFYFGTGGAGGVQANIERWVKQFEADGLKKKITTGKGKHGNYTVVDLTGTFKKPVGPPIQMKSESLPGWRVLQVIVETENGPFFVRFDGPEKLVTSSADAFRASFGGNAKDETEMK